MRLQRNSQQLHQITTCECCHLTIFQIILTISQYKLYQDIHHKNIHNVSISAVETDFFNFELPKGKIDHCLCKLLVISCLLILED